MSSNEAARIESGLSQLARLFISERQAIPLSERFVAGFAAFEHASQLAAFGATVRFAGFFQFCAWTINHLIVS
jgi:hypothetical protein